jgi:hypothetical protein
MLLQEEMDLYYMYSNRSLEFLRINSLGNSTTTHTKEEIMDNHRSVLYYFAISNKDEELDLPALYWIPKLHKRPCKQQYIAGSCKCSNRINKFNNLIFSNIHKQKLGLVREFESVQCKIHTLWLVYWDIPICYGTVGEHGSFLNQSGVLADLTVVIFVFVLIDT